ncbi:MAG: PAS domain S-box protein [Aphanothece sp. CMT-3BRIN-NPC111]|jgi:PAS domain S-box-containing protein|nr:PAS domain S-box protein [Aphanothece sp. CMT-3BRIN-NPC111]
MADLANLVSKLQATLGKMEVALGAITEAIAWTDNDGTIQWSNATFDRLVDRGRFQVLGAKLFDLLPLEQQGQKVPVEAHPVNIALQGQPLATGEYEFQQADKKLVLEVAWASIQLREQGTSAVILLRDITLRKQQDEELRRHRQELQALVEERTVSLTAINEQLRREIIERQRAEESLQESEQRFRQLAENIHEVFWLSDSHKLQILYISPAYEEIWGRTCLSLYEQPSSYVNAIHVEDRECALGVLEKQKLGERTEVTYRIIKPDGSIRWIRDRSFPIKNKSGQLYRVAGIAEDITESKQAEEEIRKTLEKEKELGELKSRFLSTSSHEFRTPLTTILSSTELLEYYGYKLSEPEKQELFGQIATATQRMTQLLDGVLTINKAEAGKLEFKPTALDLEKFCRELVREMQLGASDQHKIAFVNQGNCTSAVMDEKLLRHILSNLLSNAIKYSPQGGTVNFELFCQEQEAMFQIKDSGIGIPVEDLQRLFESFHRAENVGNIPGTGLGLSIVKRMVDLHQGRIWVDSQVGVGTTFTVAIPLNSGLSSGKEG